MPPRSQTHEGLQIGAESTAGTGVSAGKLLQGLYKQGPMLPVVPVTMIRGEGAAIDLASITGKELGRMRFQGPLDYINLTYVLAGHLLDASPASGIWTFTPTHLTPNVPKTFTVEAGQSARAEALTFGLFDSMAIRLGLTECTLQASLIGRTVTEGATLTASPTAVVPVPVGVKEWKVQLGANVAGLADFADVLACSFESRDRWGPYMTADTAQASFSSYTEPPVNIRVRVRGAYGSALSGEMVYLRSQATRVLRISCTSATSPHALTITMPYRYVGTERDFQEAITTGEFELAPVYNSTVGNFLSVVLDSQLSSL